MDAITLEGAVEAEMDETEGEPETIGLLEDSAKVIDHAPTDEICNSGHGIARLGYLIGAACIDSGLKPTARYVNASDGWLAQL